MRKFLIALLATAALPAVAQAQDRSRDEARAEGRAARAEWRQSGEGRAKRAQQRDAFAARADRSQRAERPVADAGAQAQVQDSGRGSRGNWRRDPQPAQSANTGPVPQQLAPQAERRGDRYNGQRNWNGGNDRRRDWNNDNDGQRDWNRGNNNRRDWDRNNDGRRDWDRNNDGRRDWNGNRAGNRDFRNWDRSWRNNNRYNWQGYRASNRYAYRLPRYYAPGGWNYGYRRFSIGATLFAGLFSQNYWIDDPWQYRLPPAYWPYQWVRYYSDALLVDTRSGYVVDSIPDIFWY